MQNGEPCDLLILADNVIIDSMMMPQLTDSYYIFAGNEMVLISRSEHKSINSENWMEKLLDPLATFGHFNPGADPGGYRAVMACMLADKVQPGLSEKLLEHPGRRILHSLGNPAVDYMFTYRSMPVKKGMPYASLPAVMNLSDSTLDEIYASVKIDLDGDGINVVQATSICHAITIPFSAREPGAAKQFANLFLQTNFQAQGFLPRSQAAGNWT